MSLRPITAIALAVCLLAPALFAGTVGMFAGKVIHPVAQDPPRKWLYVKGRGPTVRRVEVSKARYEYSDNVPRAARASAPADDLKEGAVVQVAAEQDGSGEWVARSVLFLKLADRSLVRSSAR
jgi:hypothetical protein